MNGRVKVCVCGGGGGGGGQLPILKYYICVAEITPF